VIQSFARLARHAVPDPQGWARLGRRRIYILPTGPGVLYGLTLPLMLVGSLNYGSNIGLLFTFLFVALGLVGMLHTWRNLLDLELAAADAAPVFAGAAAQFPVRLREAAGRERPALELSAGEGRTLTELAPGGEVQVLLAVATWVRGDQALGPVTLATRYPLGLLRAWSYLESPARVLVYPRPGARGPMLARPRYCQAEQGDRGVGADDFVGLRPYRPGDPPRHLDWKAWARARGLFTRQFGGDRAEELWLDWGRLADPDPEVRLERLCRMVLEAAREGLHFGLRLPGISIAPAGGDSHKHLCLAALARFTLPAPGTSPAP
jgi:uncharacterized protein (DUF58 family)